MFVKVISLFMCPLPLPDFTVTGRLKADLSTGISSKSGDKATRAVWAAGVQIAGVLCCISEVSDKDVSFVAIVSAVA